MHYTQLTVVMETSTTAISYYTGSQFTSSESEGECDITSRRHKNVATFDIDQAKANSN